MNTLIRFGKFERTTLVTDSSKDVVVPDFVIRENIHIKGDTYKILNVATLIGDYRADMLITVAPLWSEPTL